jgi:hypothetical protein
MATCGVPTTPQVLRFTLLDGCGRPQYGPCSSFVTDSFSQVEIGSEIEEGESFTATKANGGTCVDTRNPDRVRWDTWTLDMCMIDPELWGTINDNYRLLYDYLGGVAGWAEGYNIASSNAVAVEMWVNVAADQIDLCEDENAVVEGLWFYFLAPKMINWRRGDTLTFSGEFNPVQLTGITSTGVRWGRGPYDVVLNDAGAAGPMLQPAATDDRLLALITSVPPPAPACGCQPLSNPAAPALNVAPDLTADPTGMTVCATMASAAGEWLVDFGDGTTAQAITAGTPVCHTYASDGDYFVGIWNVDTPNLYRAVPVSVPQTMTLTVDPTSGVAPLTVTATVEGESGNVTFDW